MQLVEIRVASHLDEKWAEWLDGFAFVHTAGCETILAGHVKDQAELYGLIAKLRDMGVKLLSVNYKGQPSKECP